MSVEGPGGMDLKPAKDWEYYCEPCRAMLILSGDNRDMIDLGDV